MGCSMLDAPIIWLIEFQDITKEEANSQNHTGHLDCFTQKNFHQNRWR